MRGALIYVTDPRIEGLWPSFEADVEPALRIALDGLEVRRDRTLPGLVRGHRVAIAMWASHFDDLLASDVLTLGEGLRAVSSALLLRGRLGDRRFHPHTAAILALIALGRVTLYRDRHTAERSAAAFREEVAEVWDRGYLLVLPASAWSAPKHGHSFHNTKLQVHSMPGNVADATSLAVPFGRFRNGMPRALQVMGPPGSEELILDIGERLGRAST
jgi:Asp-tRNA(Asn)/Glu-tRNA(Gln) amidotransferase A subunit family amidase